LPSLGVRRLILSAQAARQISQDRGAISSLRLSGDGLGNLQTARDMHVVERGRHDVGPHSVVTRIDRSKHDRPLQPGWRASHIASRAASFFDAGRDLTRFDEASRIAFAVAKK
jgi:hypothetical protein